MITMLNIDSRLKTRLIRVCKYMGIPDAPEIKAGLASQIRHLYNRINLVKLTMPYFKFLPFEKRLIGVASHTYYQWNVMRSFIQKFSWQTSFNLSYLLSQSANL